ncbi:MAG: DUF1080 domain-containing protein [Sedimentisphaerales bacterium]|nr:DUF1080 domain-containing protein [Sedimentisphaerales bacterium]
MVRFSCGVILLLGLFLVPAVRADLVHRYSFNSGDTIAVDSVGGAHGTLENGAVISGNAVQLDGNNDSVKLPAGLITGWTSVTFEGWFTHAANGTWTRLFDFGDTSPSGDGRHYIFFTPAGGSSQARLAISDADPGYNHEQIAHTGTIAYGPQVHVVCVYDGDNDTLSLYVNGAPVDSIPVTIPLLAVNNVYSYLGRSLYNPDPYLAGSIDEFRVYDEPLAEEVIAQHYNAGPDVIGASPVIIEESGGTSELIEGDGTPETYTVRLASEPLQLVTLTADPDGQLDLGRGPDRPIDLHFDDQNWAQPQTIEVRAYDDDVLETDPHNGWITHAITSGDPDFNAKPLPPVVVSIRENECGAWNFQISDLNFDCRVNLADYALYASLWLTPLAGVSLDVLVAEWLSTTQPYVPGAVVGPVQDSIHPLYVDPGDIVGAIDEKIYGHFLEHIYHSVNGGLWGELVWNRSFEQWPDGTGSWSIDGDEVVQSSLETNIRLLFGDTAWGEVEYTLQARKTGGAEGFLILFRADGNEFYWCNLGGWGNTLHALEKGVSGGSWGVVGPQVPGSITAGQWYDIRIRCESNRFRVWLDEDEIIDYTDTNNPHLTGQVGLGTWATTARFRNLTVRELGTETLLFSGLPAINSQGVPAFWQGYGAATFSLDGSALNSDFCLRMELIDDSETGIEQSPFHIAAQQYSGSLWARGAAPGGMAVRLLDGQTVLGQAQLPEPNAVWTEYPFTITAAAAAPNATLQIQVAGPGTVYLDQVSLMGRDALDTGGFRPDLLEAVSALRPPILRWPGGYFAELYRWKDAIGPQHQRVKYPIVAWDDQDVNAYGTDEFIAMCRRIGAEPLIVINIGTHESEALRPVYLQEAQDWLEYCNGAATTPWGGVRAANGHPEPYNVKYWEIDNETWFQMDAVTYSLAALEFIAALKAKDPTIKILACGSGGYNQSWNQTVIDYCAESIDYISIHHYEDPDAYQSGPVAFETYINQLGDIILASDNPGVRIYMSEWNAQSTDWRTGLYAGGLLNGFERQGDVLEIGGPALFLRHLSASDWDNAFINFDHTGWFAAPNYVVMKLWRDHHGPHRILASGQTGELNAVASASADGDTVYFKAVNAGDQDVPVKLVLADSFTPGGASLKRVAPGWLGARNSLASPDVVRAEPAYVGVAGQVVRFTLPALSAGVVTITRAP